MLRYVRIVGVLLLLCGLAFAQTDKPSSKDHPLFTRMPGYYILDYVERQFDAVNMPVKDVGTRPKPAAVEGKLFTIIYRLPKDTKTPASTLQIVFLYLIEGLK